MDTTFLFVFEVDRLLRFIFSLVDLNHLKLRNIFAASKIEFWDIFVMLLHIVDLPRDAKYVEDNDDQGHYTKDLSKAGPSLDVVRVDRRRRLGGGLLLSRLSPGGISLFQQNSTMVFEYGDTNLESETVQT